MKSGELNMYYYPSDGELNPRHTLNYATTVCIDLRATYKYPEHYIGRHLIVQRTPSGGTGDARWILKLVALSTI